MSINEIPSFWLHAKMHAMSVRELLNVIGVGGVWLMITCPHFYA
jgi:hypothetical protein